MRTHVLLILLLVSSISLASTNGTYQQKVNPKIKIGNTEIYRSDLINNASRQVESYLESTGWSRKKKDAFREAFGNFITAIDSGNISSRDLTRKWIDTTGTLTNTTGRGFDANGAVCHYLDMIADKIVEVYYYKQLANPSQNNSNSGNDDLDDITRILKKNK